MRPCGDLPLGMQVLIDLPSRVIDGDPPGASLYFACQQLRARARVGKCMRTSHVRKHQRPPARLQVFVLSIPCRARVRIAVSAFITHASPAIASESVVFFEGAGGCTEAGQASKIEPQRQLLVR